MPTATNGTVELYYEADGDGDPVAFLPDVGCGAWLWGWQAPAVAGRFEAIVTEPRGVGRSDAPPGPYSVAAMAADLEAVLADAGARNATLVGAGLGGMVALRYALDYGRADALVLMGTAASGADFDARRLLGDPRATLDAALSGAFVADHPDAVDRIVGWRREEDATGDAADAHAAAVDGFDVADRLHEITVPALVMHGTADAVVPVGAGEALAEGLPRGRFDPFEGDAHWFFVEQARLATDALAGFLEGR